MECSTENEIEVDIRRLYERLQEITDNRHARGIRYSLPVILIIVILANICGEDTPYAIAEWAKNRGKELVTALGLIRGRIPHHSTFRRILASVVDIVELEQIICDILGEDVCKKKMQLIAIDGKVLRGTLDEQQNGTYLLAAYLPEEKLVLAEVAIDGKGSEITAIPKVLEGLDLQNKWVMSDALHTHKSYARSIVEGGGEYILLVKGNQPQLEENICLWFEPDPTPLPGMSYPSKDFETATDTCKGHGRIEKRTLTVSSQLTSYLDWPYLGQVFKLERDFHTVKTGVTSSQVVYGITSLTKKEVSPAQLLSSTRSYWGIENGLHYRRDTTLHEDRTRMTQGYMGQAMACINNLIIGILIGKLKFRYLPSARRFFSAHFNLLMNAFS